MKFFTIATLVGSASATHLHVTDCGIPSTAGPPAPCKGKHQMSVWGPDSNGACDWSCVHNPEWNVIGAPCTPPNNGQNPPV